MEINEEVSGEASQQTKGKIVGAPSWRLPALGNWEWTSYVVGRGPIGLPQLVLSWKQGQKLGKLSVIGQVWVHLGWIVTEAVVRFSGLVAAGCESGFCVSIKSGHVQFVDSVFTSEGTII